MWKRKGIEKVREIKYLGYTLMRNGGQEAHIRERRKKAAIDDERSKDRKENGEKTGREECNYMTH